MHEEERMTRRRPDPVIAAVTAAAFGFVATILLVGKAPEERANPVASLVSKYVVASNRR
jgi:hypothetical protein